MPPRSRQTATADYEEEASDGVAARIAERILDNPALSGGLFVMALTATAIVSNAMFLQSARHPDPLFMTRPGPVADAAEDEVPLPRPRAIPLSVAEADEPPLPAIAPAKRDAPPPPAPAQAVDRTLVRDIQRGLAERGLYAGAIDGIPGSRTRAAITAYQKSAGLPVTGEISPNVLDHMATASLKAAPAADAPPPPPKAVAKAVPAPAAEADQIEAIAARDVAPEAEAAAARPKDLPAAPTVAVDKAPVPAAVKRVPTMVVRIDPNRKPAPAVAPIPDADLPVVAARNADSPRTVAVQKALNQIGYGPVPEDGLSGGETSDAIRRFELDNGLPITGMAGDQVVDRLVAIGAMEAI